ncbi:hypothetical protein [Paradevosia shaoguanensis]|uniref:hypothetical protein n=1 Tax=Paradevosia shaoguanensis TaxID=1335043 RepID=UPI0019312226|nr:hypothetical protein [Paradevosia shaoguanensis]
MSYNVLGGALQTAPVKLTDSNPTTVLAADRAGTTVLSVICTETAGSTPNLTIAKTDGTTTIYYRNAKAMTAKETVVFETVIVLKNQWSLQITSSSPAGGVDVDVTYLAPDRTAQGGQFMPLGQR